MGYSFKIKSDKEIKICDIESIIEEIPVFYREVLKMPWSKQPWGWSLYSDVKLSKDFKEISISGSFGMSGRYAEGFILQFLNRLLKRGYFAVCESDDFNL